jgi:hypothetical protein
MDVDHYVRERLAKFLAKKAGHQRKRYMWAFFAKLGSISCMEPLRGYTAAPTASR